MAHLDFRLLTEIGAVTVSTVRLVPPDMHGRTYETLVLPEGQECDRYHSREEAEAGHAQMVERIRSKAPMSHADRSHERGCGQVKIQPALHGVMATLLRRESRSEDISPDHAADLYAQSCDAADRAGYDGMTDSWAFLAGWTGSLEPFEEQIARCANV